MDSTELTKQQTKLDQLAHFYEFFNFDEMIDELINELKNEYQIPKIISRIAINKLKPGAWTAEKKADVADPEDKDGKSSDGIDHYRELSQNFIDIIEAKINDDREEKAKIKALLEKMRVIFTDPYKACLVVNNKDEFAQYNPLQQTWIRILSDAFKLNKISQESLKDLKDLGTQEKPTDESSFEKKKKGRKDLTKAITAKFSIKNYTEQLQQQEQRLNDEFAKSSEDDKVELDKEISILEERYSRLKDTYKNRVEVLRQVYEALNKLQPQISETAIIEAQTALLEGDTSKAAVLFEQTIVKSQNVLRQASIAEYQLGKIASDQLKYPTAYKRYQRAAQLQPSNSNYLNETGMMANTLADYEKAIEYYEQALASDLKTFGEDHPNIAIRRNNLGVTWNAIGEHRKAIEYYEQALASGVKTFGSDHPKVATNRNNLGMAWEALGEHQKAIGYYEKALESDLKTVGPDHPKIALRLDNLGGAWKEVGNYNKAIEYYEQALTSDLETYENDHPDVGIRWNNLAVAWDALGEHHMAIQYYEQALAIFEKSLGKDHLNTKTVRENLNKKRAKLKNIESAEA